MVSPLSFGLYLSSDQHLVKGITKVYSYFFLLRFGLVWSRVMVLRWGLVQPKLKLTTCLGFLATMLSYSIKSWYQLLVSFASTYCVVKKDLILNF